MASMRRRCVVCEHEFQVLEMGGVQWAEDHRLFEADVDPDVLERAIEAGDLYECPECGCAELQPVITAGLGIRLGGEAGVGREYPYFDRNLGRRIESATHHRQVCRELGVRQADDGMQVEIDQARRRRAQVAADEAAYDQMLAEYDADPEICRARDQMDAVMADAGRGISDAEARLNAQREAMARMNYRAQHQ